MSWFLVLPACRVDFQTEEPGPTPTTAQITEDADRSDLEGHLLTLADLTDVPGLPADMFEESISQTELFENPDPRHPCGAPAPELNFSSGDVSILRSEDEPFTVFHAVFDLGKRTAQDAIGDYERDIRPGCDTFVTETHVGLPQENTFLEEVALPKLGDDEVATVSLIHTRGSAPVYGAQGLIREQGLLSVIFILGAERPSEATIRAVMVAAGKKL